MEISVPESATGLVTDISICLDWIKNKCGALSQSESQWALRRQKFQSTNVHWQPSERASECGGGGECVGDSKARRGSKRCWSERYCGAGACAGGGWWWEAQPPRALSRKTCAAFTCSRAQPKKQRTPSIIFFLLFLSPINSDQPLGAVFPGRRRGGGGGWRWRPPVRPPAGRTILWMGPTSVR